MDLFTVPTVEDAMKYMNTTEGLWLQTKQNQTKSGLNRKLQFYDKKIAILMERVEAVREDMNTHHWMEMRVLAKYVLEFVEEQERLKTNKKHAKMLMKLKRQQEDVSLALNGPSATLLLQESKTFASETMITLKLYDMDGKDTIRTVPTSQTALQLYATVFNDIINQGKVGVDNCRLYAKQGILDATGWEYLNSITDMKVVKTIQYVPSGATLQQMFDSLGIPACDITVYPNITTVGAGKSSRRNRASHSMYQRKVAMLFASPFDAVPETGFLDTKQYNNGEEDIGDQDSPRSGSSGEYKNNSDGYSEEGSSSSPEYSPVEEQDEELEEEGLDECLKCWDVLGKGDVLVCASCVATAKGRKMKVFKKIVIDLSENEKNETEKNETEKKEKKLVKVVKKNTE